MSDAIPVKASTPSLTRIQLPTKGTGALTIPDLHQRAEIKNSHDDDASVQVTSTATTAARESTASSFAMPNSSSQSSSAEPTESATPPSNEPHSSASSSAPPSPTSPIRVPARLRRKCPVYVPLAGERDDSGGTSSSAPATPVKVEPEEYTYTTPPTAGGVVVSPPSRKTE